MTPILFIELLDAYLAKKNLAFLSVAVDILLVAGAAWLLSYLAGRLIRRLVRIALSKSPESMHGRLRTTGSILITAVRYACIFVAAAIILGELGLQKAMTSLLAAAGIGGLALGIGAQNLIGDVAAGFFMLMENELNLGDYVRIGELEGTVETLSLRTTGLRGLRGELHTIHNGQIKTVTNFSRGTYLALVDFEIAYEADLPRARALIREEAALFMADFEAAAPDAPPMDMGVVELGQNGVTLRLGLTLTRSTARWEAERAMRQRVKTRFDKEKIEIPYDKLVVFQR